MFTLKVKLYLFCIDFSNPLRGKTTIYEFGKGEETPWAAFPDR